MIRLSSHWPVPAGRQSKNSLLRTCCSSKPATLLFHAGQHAGRRLYRWPLPVSADLRRRSRLPEARVAQLVEQRIENPRVGGSRSSSSAAHLFPSGRKAARSAAALSDRLERYWDSLRMEMIYSKELGLTVLPETRTVAADSFSLTDALALYHRLKGTGKTSLFFESSERSIRYLIECLGHDSLTSLEVSDAGRFRDYLFERGMSSSSVKRVFSSVRAVINLAIREHGLSVTNVFSGTFIPDDEVKKKRLPIPAPDLVWHPARMHGTG